MSKLLKDAEIVAAVRDVARGKKASATLSDPAPRGAGRLVLVVKPGQAEWYAQRFVEGKRRLQKLGGYPAVTLAEAREKFAGHRPATGRSTVGDLFDSYLATLAGRPSHKQAKSVLATAGKILGRGRMARDVTSADIVAVVKPSHRAGKICMAEKRRMFVSAAFSWAIKSTHDYRTDNPRDWGLAHNPVDALPVDERAYNSGTRWLDAKEFFALLAWAKAGRPGSARHAIAVIMLTGQRVSEICRIETVHWDRKERTLHWPTTKNGKPHTVPVCEQAAALLDAIRTNGTHLYRGNHPRPHLSVDAVRVALDEYGGDFCARDLRRTWKTLAGQAGLTKVDRDLIQNHGQTGISSKHYDRWEYMPEKRSGVALWQAWLSKQLGEQHAKGQANEVVQPEEDRRSEHVAGV